MREDVNNAEAVEEDGGGFVGSRGGVLAGHLRSQRAFLEQFLRPAPGAFEQRLRAAPRELAAGMPLEAARLLLLGGRGPGVGCADVEKPPWCARESEAGGGDGCFPAHLACVAIALRLFAVLLPGQAELHNGACERLCTSTACLAGSSATALFEAAHAARLAVRAVSSGVESLAAMVQNRPVACCVVLEAYVGVLEDPSTGEEFEEEVGLHCVMVLGGDISGPSYVVYDPWGPSGGEVAYWSLHDFDRASPSAWVELTPLASELADGANMPKVSVASAVTE